MPDTSKQSVEDRDNLYYTPHQVSQHNIAEDCWLSWLGHVYNVSDLTLAAKGFLLFLLLWENAHC